MSEHDLNYWRQRALAAEARLAEIEQQAGTEPDDHHIGD